MGRFVSAEALTPFSNPIRIAVPVSRHPKAQLGHGHPLQHLPYVFAVLDPSDSLCQCAPPQLGQGAPLWPQAQAHYKVGIQVLGYPIVKEEGSVRDPLPLQIPGPERTSERP